MMQHDMPKTTFHYALIAGTMLLVFVHFADAADPPIKTTFNALDKSGNGTLSVEEYLASPGLSDLKIARRNFKVVDFDRNGSLSFEEFQTLPGLLPIDQRGTFPDPIAELATDALKTWRSLLKTADRNQDAKLSIAEWPHAALKTKLPPFGDLKFETWDADGNGSVDEQEGQRVIAVGFGTEYPDGTVVRSSNGRVLFISWIRAADKNGDHLLSREEFVASYWLTPPERAKLFSELDQNQDGELKCDEMAKSPGLNIDVLGMFLHFDKDLDGLIDLTELCGNESSGASKQQSVFSLEACDDDHDGKLSLREYMRAPAGMAYVTLRLFDRKDSDQDGHLGWSEFYTEDSPAMIGVAWDLFRRFDRNHDGRLGLDEFQYSVDLVNVPLEVVFRIKDADRSGRLVLAEFFTPLKPTSGDPQEMKRYQLRLTRATDQFQRDDADRNGEIDLAEFTRARKALADSLQETPGEYATRLFVANSDGSNMKQLTDLPEFQSQGSPVWSSDGKYIAFDGWKPPNGVNGSREIVVVQADGKNPRVLLPGAMPSFSPGGNRIFFSNSSAGGVWIVSSQGTDQGLFEISRNGWGSDWSTDGRMVYATSTAGGANLAVFNPVEGDTQLLFDVSRTPYRQIFWNMAWSPDSKRVVFKAVTTGGKQEVGIIDARGEKFGFIRRFEGEILASFAWSPLENRILFIKQDPVSRHNQIYFVDPDSKDPPRLLPVQDELRNYSDIAYSPDGKRIVFSCSKRTSFE